MTQNKNFVFYANKTRKEVLNRGLNEQEWESGMKVVESETENAHLCTEEMTHKKKKCTHLQQYYSAKAYSRIKQDPNITHDIPAIRKLKKTKM